MAVMAMRFVCKVDCVIYKTTQRNLPHSRI